MKTKMKPCPFCGYAPTKGDCWVYCGNTDCAIGWKSIERKKWNRRKAKKEKK